MPFELRGREYTGDGVRLRFRCGKCGTEATIIISHNDSLEQAYPILCPCSPQAYIQTEPGLTGKALLEAIKNAPEPPDDLLDRNPPSPN